jgi:ABC-type phosphate transport system auxiliary subunit
MEEESTGVPMPAEGTTEGATQSTEAGAATQAGPQAEGRRTQLKIVRENIHSLSNDVGSFRKSHETSIKKLEKQVAALRSELAAQTVSKDVANFRKNHDVSAKRLEKQIATLRNELAALKSSIARDAARSRAKQEATLSRILAKVSAKPAKSKPAKSTKKR